MDGNISEIFVPEKILDQIWSNTHDSLDLKVQGQFKHLLYAETYSCNK